ncbi:hypothetical protein LBWT_X4090 (plasmid) [Leptolyngbya boryana IAM M-101]|nr:hypothetical protein LBWT_X4090 [Leptolyngbya boryana IAM M-101]BAS66685.1 hypothetical protein LBDG_X4090 [Leptolyngbya boryana dg5]
MEGVRGWGDLAERVIVSLGASMPYGIRVLPHCLGLKLMKLFVFGLSLANRCWTLSGD